MAWCVEHRSPPDRLPTPRLSWTAVSVAPTAWPQSTHTTPVLRTVWSRSTVPRKASICSVCGAETQTDMYEQLFKQIWNKNEITQRALCLLWCFQLHVNSKTCNMSNFVKWIKTALCMHILFLALIITTSKIHFCIRDACEFQRVNIIGGTHLRDKHT